MFDELFVTCSIAVRLKEIGYNEPCMGAHSTKDNKLHVKYTTDPTDFFNLAVKKLNSEFPDYLYAAPLYQQVFDWLLNNGIYFHEFRIPKLREQPARWGVNLYDMDGMQLWPANFEGVYFDERLTARDYGILAALEILQCNKEKI